MRGMKKTRADIVADVQKKVASGALRWDNLRTHLRQPTLKEAVHISCELEEPDADQGPRALREEDARAAHEAESKADWEEEGADGQDAALVPVLPGDPPAAVAAAEDVRRRLEMMDGLEKAARAAKMPKIQWICDSEQRRIKKGAFQTQDPRAEPNAVLQRFLKDRHCREIERGRKSRQKSARKRRGLALIKRVAAKKNRAKAVANALEANRRKKLAKIPKHFSDKDLGQGAANPGGAKETAARRECMERLKLRAPALPDWLEVEWHSLRDWWAANIGKDEKERVGQTVAMKANQILMHLGPHIKPGEGGAPAAARASVGDRRAFEKFVEKLYADRPKAVTGVVV